MTSAINRKIEFCNTMFSAIDSTWQKRKRKLDTASIFSNICDSSSTKRGFKHILTKQDCIYTAQALGAARKKIPEHSFSDVNKSMHDLNTRNSSKVYAVDGSKIHVHTSFAKQGCKSQTNDKPVPRIAKRPLIMLSSLLDVDSQTCYHSHITQHFNERKSAMEHFKVLKPGDTVIFDRGYYSKVLLMNACNLKLKVLFRLKRNAFRAANTFWNSNKTIQNIIVPNETTGTLHKIRLVKYFIDGHKYMNLVNFESDISDIRKLYSKRWAVETSFRRLKTNLNLECAHSMSYELYCQEIQARILLDSIVHQVCDIVSSHNTKSMITYFTILECILDSLYILSIATQEKWRKSRWKHHVTNIVFRRIF
jgi:hypothetical protein